MSIRIGIGLDVFGAGIDANAQTIYNRIIADGGVSNLSRLNFFVKGLKAIYGDLANVPVCYDAHWIGYKLGSGTGATAGQAAAKLYSLTVAGDAVQTTAASQPLLLSHNGASTDNYWWGSGVNGNFASTPNAAANQITGDIEIKATAKYIFNGSYAIIAAKWGAQTSFRLYIGPNDRLIFEFGGLSTATSTVVITSAMNHFKATRNTTNGNILFYYSNEAITTDINSVTWIQLGTTISGTVGAFTSSTNNVTIGQELSNAFQGKIYRATISNSIGGTPVVDFNPAQYNASTSQTAWTSSTGEVWTINTGTATSGYKGQLVSKTIVMGDGVDDIIGKNSAFTSTKNISVYSAKRSYNVTDSDGYVTSGVNPGDMTQSDINFSITGTLFSPTGRSTILQFAALRQSSANTSKVRYNANADTSGTPTTTACSRIILFGSPYAWDFASAQYSNNILSTVIIASTYDSDAITTAIYGFIRGLNENAF